MAGPTSIIGLPGRLPLDAALSAAIDDLLADQDRCRVMAQKGEAYVESQAKVIDRVADEIDVLLRFRKNLNPAHAAA